MDISFFFGFSYLCFFACMIYYFLNRSRGNNKFNKPSILLFSFRIGIIFCYTFIVFLFISNIKQIYRKIYDMESLVLINGAMFVIFVSVVFLAFSLKHSREYFFKLPYPSRSESRRGSIKLGKILYKNHKKYNFYLDLEDLTQHMFICGITGSGKSNLVQHFLLKFTRKHSLPFLLAEFKGEYQFLQERIPNLLILKPGENFSINMFNPEGADAQVHAERIFQIFESGGIFDGIEYSPQMERVFVDILNKVCNKKENRNWTHFQEICRYNRNHSKDPTLEKSIQAIENRIRRYNIGTLKKIFSTESMMGARSLFNHNILLDLSSIIRLGGEKQDALFFLNMVLKYLWDKNVSEGSEDYNGIRHMTIIEDAQYFAPERGGEKVRLSTYLEDIALLLRGTGECLISLATRPNISREILANCGILACFQTHLQKDTMVELLNLQEDRKEYLSMLKKGVCIVRVNSIEYPFVLKIPHIKRNWISREIIEKNNQSMLEEHLSLMKKKHKNKKYRLSEKFIPTQFRENLIDHGKTEKSNTESESERNFCSICGREITTGCKYCATCISITEAEEREIKKLEYFLEKIVKE